MSSCTSLALAAFSVFVSAQAADPVPESPAVTQLREFLDAGFDRRRTSDSDVEDEYRDLRSGLDDSLTAEYAYALVLLKRNQFDEAMEILSGLREQTTTAYAPAWQASIWHLLSRRQFESGYEQLAEFAKLSTDSDQQWSRLGQAQLNARWMGKLVAGLGYQFSAGRPAKELQAARDKVEAALSDALKQEFHKGIDEVQAFRQQLEGGATATQQQVQQEQAQAAKETAEDLKAQEEAALDSKDQLALTAEEWKKKYRKESVDLGRKIGSLQRDFGLLEAQRASLERSITLVQREKTALDVQRQNDKFNQNLQPSNRRNNQYIIEENRLLQQFNQYQTELQQTLVAMQQTAAQGTQLLGQLQALTNAYEKATGELVKQDKELEKLAAKLDKEQADIAAGNTKPRDPTELKQLRKRMKYFSTYVDFDFEEEKQKLVDLVRASQSQGG